MPTRRGRLRSSTSGSAGDCGRFAGSNGNASARSGVGSSRWASPRATRTSGRARARATGASRALQSSTAHCRPPTGPTRAWKGSSNPTAVSGMPSEPPGADPHAGWCGGRRGKPGAYPIRRSPRCAPISGGWMVGSGRCAALRGCAVGDWSPGFGGSRGWGSSEVAVFEPVGIAFEREDLGVMDEAVDHRGRGDFVAEDLAPGAERLVRGDDQARAFIAAADEHEHQVRGLGIERDVADLVADQQWDPLELVELAIEPAVALRVGEEGDPLGRGTEHDAVPGEARADPQRDPEVRLAGAGRVAVALLIVLMVCRSGCGWWPRRAGCGIVSLRCWAGRPMMARGRSRCCAGWWMAVRARSRRGGRICR